MRFSGTIVLIFTSTIKAHPIRRRALAPILFFCLVFLFPATFLNTNTFQNFFPNIFSLRILSFYPKYCFLQNWQRIYNGGMDLYLFGSSRNTSLNFFQLSSGYSFNVVAMHSPYTCSIDKEDVSKQESRPIFNFLN